MRRSQSLAYYSVTKKATQHTSLINTEYVVYQCEFVIKNRVEHSNPSVIYYLQAC